MKGVCRPGFLHHRSPVENALNPSDRVGSRLEPGIPNPLHVDLAEWGKMITPATTAMREPTLDIAAQAGEHFQPDLQATCVDAVVPAREGQYMIAERNTVGPDASIASAIATIPGSKTAPPMCSASMPSRVQAKGVDSLRPTAGRGAARIAPTMDVRPSPCLRSRRPLRAPSRRIRRRGRASKKGSTRPRWFRCWPPDQRRPPVR